MNRNRLAVALFTAVLLTAAFAATASANVLGTMEIYGGYAKSSTELPTALNETLGGGMTFGAGYYRNLAPTTQWGVEASYDNLGSKDWADGLGDTGTISVSTLRVSPQFRVNFGAPVGPSFFAQGGVGYYNVSTTMELTALGMPSISADASDGKFGFNLGAGVGFPVGPKTKLSFQGQYHSVATEGTSTNYLNFRAGLGFGL